jgi:hypothetical protein
VQTAANDFYPPLLTVAADGSGKTLVEIRTLMTASLNRPLSRSSAFFGEFSQKKTVHSGDERTAKICTCHSRNGSAPLTLQHALGRR